METKSVIIKLSNAVGIDADKSKQCIIYNKLRPMLDFLGVPPHVHSKRMMQRGFVSYELLQLAINWYQNGFNLIPPTLTQDELIKTYKREDGSKALLANMLKIPYRTWLRLDNSLSTFKHKDISVGVGLKLLEFMGHQQVTEFCDAVETIFGVDISMYAYQSLVDDSNVFGANE